MTLIELMIVVSLLALLTVAFVALPLALGFGVTSGAGATAGIVTAIVAGIVAAIFGGSDFQITGPTGAMTAVLLPIVAVHGPGALPILGVGAGLILIVLAFAGVGKYVRYIPWPVVTGFTNGIAVIIFLQQLPNLLGLEQAFTSETILVASWEALNAFLANPQWQAPLLAAVSVLIMVGWSARPKLRIVPAGIITLVAVTLVSLLPAFDAVPRIGLIPQDLPDLAWPAFNIDLTGLVRSAVAVAVLALGDAALWAHPLVTLVRDARVQGP